MNINSVLSAPALAFGRHQQFTDFNFADIAGIGRAFPGFTFPVRGALFQVIRNVSGGALAVGDATSIYFGNAARTGNLVGASTTAVAVTDDTFAPDVNIGGDDSFPAYASFTAGVLATTAAMQRRQVLGNSIDAGASTITVAKAEAWKGPTEQVATGSANALTGTPDATWDYDVVAPYENVKAAIGALGTSWVQGIVVSTSITDKYYGIIQLTGLAMASVDGTTDLVAGDMLIPDAAGGVLSKWAVGAPDANGVTRSNFICARIMNAYTNDGVGLRQVQLVPRCTFVPWF